MPSTRRSSTTPTHCFADASPRTRWDACIRARTAWSFCGCITATSPASSPQHGPGKKHERPILLEPWQQALVEAAPWAFLRGCIRSDGCVFINRTGKYEYLSYEFKNRSPGIRELFAATCDRVGVACRVNGDRIAIYRRSSVALLLEHVGIKS
jgi:hypothetical protein